MDIIGEVGTCESPHLKELARSTYMACQLDSAISAMKDTCYVSHCIRNICCGAYVLSSNTADELYLKLKAPIDRHNRHITRTDRDKVLQQLNKLKADLVVSRFNKLSFEDEGAATSDPCAIYGANGSLNEPYIKLLSATKVDWILRPREKRPITVEGLQTEKDWTARLLEIDSVHGNWLIKWTRYVQVHQRVEFGDEVCSSGEPFNESDYRFSRAQVPLEFRDWEFGRGTVGLFVTMNHPRLGRRTYAMTCAHVVFAHLTGADQDEIARFNNTITYAHYDAAGAEAPFSHSLDFCMIEVANNLDIHNVVNTPEKLPDWRAFTTDEAVVVKNGRHTSTTIGNFYSKVGDIGGRASLLVSASERAAFADEGDSGSVYLLQVEADSKLLPVALHCRGSKSATNEGLWLSGGCSIVECLRKFVQKETRAQEPPDDDDIRDWFVLTRNVYQVR